MNDKNKKIIDSSLYLAKSQGWEYTTLRDIAEHAGISAADLYSVIDDKGDIITMIGRMIDKKLMDGLDISSDDESSARERLFDIMMDRYEVLNEYRDGICAILESFKCDPKQIIISMPHLCKSMSLMLEISGIETSGIKGAMKVAGLTGIYLKVLRIWIKDEDEDLSKTMAYLDKTLERAERAANILGF